MKRFLIITGLLVVTATPAFAQWPDINHQAYYDAQGVLHEIAPQHQQAAVRKSGLDSFAMASDGQSYLYSRALNGGGSDFYNYNMAQSAM